MTTTAPSATRPAFREPWTYGAHSYTQADTFQALKDGMKRKRKARVIHMANSGEAGDMPCASCGTKLKDPYVADKKSGHVDKAEKHSVWHYDPKTQKGYGQHYYCSWMTLMAQIVQIRL